MPSFKSITLAVAAACVTVANADYIITPDSVTLSIRQSWCASEMNICPAICMEIAGGKTDIDASTQVNECDPKTLTYGCLCSNGQQPNVSEYSLSLPYFVCQEWGTQCVANCGEGNNNCAYKCRENHPCGARHPKKYKATPTATTGAAAATSTDANAIFSGVPGGSSQDTTTSAATSALEAGRLWGLPVIMAGLFVGFAVL